MTERDLIEAMKELIKVDEMIIDVQRREIQLLKKMLSEEGVVFE